MENEAGADNPQDAVEDRPETVDALSSLLLDHVGAVEGEELEVSETTADAEVDEDKQIDHSQEEDLDDAVSEESEPEEPDSDDETEAEEEAPEEPEEPVGVKKRIQKLAKKRAEAEARADKLEEQLLGLQDEVASMRDQPAQKPDPTDPSSFASNLKTVQEVEAAIGQAASLEDWCDDNLEGAEIDGKEYSAEQVKQIRRSARKAIRIDLPKRQTFLTQREQLLPKIHEVFPFFKKRASPEYQRAQQVLRAMPELKNYADYEFRVGVYMRGLESMEKTTKERAAKLKTIKKAPKSPAPPTRKPRPVNSKDRKNKVRNNLANSGTKESLADVLLSEDFIGNVVIK